MYPTSTWYRVGNILAIVWLKDIRLSCDVIKTHMNKRITWYTVILSIHVYIKPYKKTSPTVTLVLVRKE